LIVTAADGEMPSVHPTVVLDKIELTPEARKQYDDMQRRLLAEVEGDTVLAASAAVATGKLAQLANGFIYDERKVPRFVHDDKVEWLRDLVEEATGPTLLIYEYQADLATLHTVLGEGFRFLGAGVSDKQSAANIEDWNAGRLKFMGLHPASGGHGLNLQFGGADMAWMSPTWSPELWEQTIARLARPGQTRPVVVRVCVATATVDELKLLRVYGKMSAQAAFEAWLRRHNYATPSAARSAAE
jgi:hypothetical protein